MGKTLTPTDTNQASRISGKINVKSISSGSSESWNQEEFLQ